MQLKVVEGLSKNVAGFLLKGHRQMGEHLRELGNLVGLVTPDDFHVTLFALLARAQINRVAHGDCGHLHEVGEYLPVAMSIAELADELHQLFLVVGRRPPLIFGIPQYTVPFRNGFRGGDWLKTGFFASFRAGAGKRAIVERVVDDDALRELLRSHAELRAALIMAGRRIRLLNFGGRDDKALPIFRRTLRDARMVAREFRGLGKQGQ